MVNSLDLTTLVAQIPEAQRVHHAILTHPELQQALAQEQVLKRQQAEKKQIAKSEATTDETSVDHDAQHRQQHGFARDGRQPSESPDEEHPDVLPGHGQIIDVKV